MVTHALSGAPLPPFAAPPPNISWRTESQPHGPFLMLGGARGGAIFRRNSLPHTRVKSPLFRQHNDSPRGAGYIFHVHRSSDGTVFAGVDDVRVPDGIAAGQQFTAKVWAQQRSQRVPKWQHVWCAASGNAAHDRCAGCNSEQQQIGGSAPSLWQPARRNSPAAARQ